MRIQSTRPTSSINPMNTPLILALETCKIDNLFARRPRRRITKTVRTTLILRFAICAAIITITWAVFGQTVGHGFVNFDDPIYVSENDHVWGGLNWSGVVWAFTHIHSHNWHPLTTMSHMLDCQVFGVKPGAHHFVNVLLHSATAVLLFFLVAQFGPGRTETIWMGAFVATVFAIHPLRVESVA